MSESLLDNVFRGDVIQKATPHCVNLLVHIWFSFSIIVHMTFTLLRQSPNVTVYIPKLWKLFYSCVFAKMCLCLGMIILLAVRLQYAADDLSYLDIQDEKIIFYFSTSYKLIEAVLFVSVYFACRGWYITRTYLGITEKILGLILLVALLIFPIGLYNMQRLYVFWAAMIYVFSQRIFFVSANENLIYLGSFLTSRSTLRHPSLINSGCLSVILAKRQLFRSLRIQSSVWVILLAFREMVFMSMATYNFEKNQWLAMLLQEAPWYWLLLTIGVTLRYRQVNEIQPEFDFDDTLYFHGTLPMFDLRRSQHNGSNPALASNQLLLEARATESDLNYALVKGPGGKKSWKGLTLAIKEQASDHECERRLIKSLRQ